MFPRLPKEIVLKLGEDFKTNPYFQKSFISFANERKSLKFFFWKKIFFKGNLYFKKKLIYYSEIKRLQKEKLTSDGESMARENSLTDQLFNQSLLIDKKLNQIDETIAQKDQLIEGYSLVFISHRFDSSIISAKFRFCISHTNKQRRGGGGGLILEWYDVSHKF